MNERITPRRIIALIIIVIGIFLYKDAQDLKASAQDTSEYIMSPMSKAVSNPEFMSTIDVDTYMNTSMNKVIDLSIDTYKFEGTATSGISAILIGSVLFFAPSMEWEKKFWKNIASFFSPL